MDISPEFLYGVATMIGVISLGVVVYGWVYKVPVTTVLLTLKQLKEFVIQKAAETEAQRKKTVSKNVSLEDYMEEKKVSIEISEAEDENKKEALQ